MERLSGVRWRRFRVGLRESLWFVPAVYVVISIALSIVLVLWDESDPVELTESLSAASASQALSALGSGMIAFTGFVTSVVLLVLQFGSSEFSPRLLKWFRRDRTLQFALSTFFATFLFALVATAQVGRGDASFVPTRTLIAALVLTLLSIAMFLLLIENTSNGLRVANVAQRLDKAARAVFDVTYPATQDEVALAEDTARSLSAAPPVQVVRNNEVGRVLVALDRVELSRLASRADSVIEMVGAVGDHVAAGGAVFNVYGHALSEHQLMRSIVLGDERTIDDDPAFAIRMLVDVAIKALSPAVNDPTTAVQSLDRIEDLLRYAAAKHLGIGHVTDRIGTVRLVYPTPTWDDLVELALTEIRTFGARQYQVARRLHALLGDLLADVPERRRPALREQQALLDDAIRHDYREPQRAPAIVADRQGLGMGRRRAMSDR